MPRFVVGCTMCNHPTEDDRNSEGAIGFRDEVLVQLHHSISRYLPAGEKGRGLWRSISVSNGTLDKGRKRQTLQFLPASVDPDSVTSKSHWKGAGRKLDYVGNTTAAGKKKETWNKFPRRQTEKIRLPQPGRTTIGSPPHSSSQPQFRPWPSSSELSSLQSRCSASPH